MDGQQGAGAVVYRSVAGKGRGRNNMAYRTMISAMSTAVRPPVRLQVHLLLLFFHGAGRTTQKPDADAAGEP